MDVAARRRVDARVRRAPRRRRCACPGRSSTPTSAASTRAYRLYRTNDGWIQIAAVKEAHWRSAVHRARRCPSSSTTNASPTRPLGPSTATSSKRSSRRCSRRRTAIVWSRVLDDAGVPNEIPRDTQAGEAVLFDADNERARPRRRVRAPDGRPHAPVREADRLLRHAAEHRAARRRSSASTPRRSSRGSATTPTSR